MAAEQEFFENEENKKKIQCMLEAALFMSNKILTLDELIQVSKSDEETVFTALESLKEKYDKDESAIEIVINQESKTAVMQIRAKWIPSIANLAEKVELARKSTKILALIAKKGEILQSDLKKYFRGDIYAYVRELKEKQYLESSKKGNTRLLKPTKKFHEEFQVSELEKLPEPQAEQKTEGEERVEESG